MKISGLDRAEVLAGIFNRSKQQGRGLVDMSGQCEMTVPEARASLEDATRDLYFEHLEGRVLAISLFGDYPATRAYN